jgi:hypothetical protein
VGDSEAEALRGFGRLTQNFSLQKLVEIYYQTMLHCNNRIISKNRKVL